MGPRRRESLFVAVGALFALTVARGARAEAKADEIPPQCAFVAAGAGYLGTNGFHYTYAFHGTVPLFDAGYGICLRYVDLGVRLRFAPADDHFRLEPALAVRVHTPSPAGEGVEAGIGVRLGVAYLHAEQRFGNSFDASGFTAAAFTDLRYWFDDHWGVLLTVDVGVGLVNGKSPSSVEELSFFSASATGGAALRF